MLHAFQHCLESNGPWFLQSLSFWTEKCELFNFIVIFASGMRAHFWSKSSKVAFPSFNRMNPDKIVVECNSKKSTLSWKQFKWLIEVGNLAEPFLTHYCRTNSSIFKSIFDSRNRILVVLRLLRLYWFPMCACIDLIKTHSSNEHPPNTRVLPPFALVKIRPRSLQG